MRTLQCLWHVGAHKAVAALGKLSQVGKLGQLGQRSQVAKLDQLGQRSQVAQIGQLGQPLSLQSRSESLPQQS